MRVNLDVSSLGFSRGNPVYRCGQYRFVHELAIGLAASADVDLTLSGGMEGATIWQRFHNLEDSIQYQQSNDTLRNVPFAYNPLVTTLARSIRNAGWYKANPLFQLLLSQGGPPALEPYLTLLSDSSLRHSDIFHSPSSAFPKFTESIPRLRRFMTLHDMFPVLYPEFYHPVVQTAFKAMLSSVRPTDWIMCVSECTRNDLCEYLPAANRPQAFVVFLAADADMFYHCDDEEKRLAARRRYKIPDGPFVLSVCNVTRNKNQDHLVRCFADLVRQQKLDDLNLVLVGPISPHSHEVFNEIVNSGEVRNRIILTGYIKDEDLAPIYSSATMFVVPSLVDGFSLPPMEAMRCGVPVIASNACSLPEVVGDAGILVNPRDRDQLCSNMLKLYQNPSLRASMSDASLARARQFTWQNCVSRTVDAYKAAMAS